ncbi:MAG: type I-U CRISPR-associated protein Csb2 [Pirellulales bacterium]
MIAISLSFNSGRFHATPWGRHVNEGAPEWPPSPWRLLRALVATWKRKLDADLNQAAVEPVLRALADLPEFLLPRASTGHTRHYMPWFKKGPDDKTLVFDAFVATTPAAELFVVWPDARLDDQQRAVLQKLLAQVGFLGRAESWCEAQLLAPNEKPPQDCNCVPLNGGSPDGSEVVPVLCADPLTAFQSEHAEEQVTIGAGKKRRTERRAIYEPNWHLCIETAKLHAEGWSDPPGSRWVPYVRRSDCFRIDPRKPFTTSRERPALPKLQVARFALDSAVLPLLQEALPVAELARRALVFKFINVAGRRKYREEWSRAEHKAGRQPVILSPIFGGKDEHGRKRRDGHRHAFYLPTDEDGDGRLDHLTVVARDGFNDDELKAIDRLRELYSKERADSGHALRLVLLALGRLDELSALPLKTSAAWVSTTPFLVTRHPKSRGTKRDAPALLASPSAFIEAVLREELARLAERTPDMPNVKSIVPLRTNDAFVIAPRLWAPRASGRTLRPIQFKRFRQKRGDDGGRRPAGVFKITFEAPVPGPICLGHSSHFGLGLFLPATRGIEGVEG